MKKKFVSYLEIIERDVHDFVNDALNSGDDGFAEFKSRFVKLEANLAQYAKENTHTHAVAFKVHTALNEIDTQMRELYDNNRVIKPFVDAMKRIDFNVTYSRASLLDSIKFGQQSTLQIINDQLDKHELARSYTEADLDLLRRGDEPQMFGSAIAKSFRESIANSEVYGGQNDRRRTGSLLKSQANFPTPNYLYLCNLDKSSAMQSSHRKLSESYDIESRATGMHTVHSLASLKPARQNTDPCENKPRPPLNLYDKQRMTSMRSPKDGMSRNNSNKLIVGELPRDDLKKTGGELKRNESKKGILNDFMSNSTFNGQNKSTLTIRNLTMNQAEFKKAIFDALKKNKLIERIDFRDNILPFDVARCIKEMFGVPLVRPLSFDLRRNKVKINTQSLETMKAQLLKLNVTIIV